MYYENDHWLTELSVLLLPLKNWLDLQVPIKGLVE